MSHAAFEDPNLGRTVGLARFVNRNRLILLVAVCLILAGAWELRSSQLQSWFFWRWSSALSYTIEAGPSPRIAFPVAGPFDERRGYTRLPQFRERLEAHGFRVSEQARQDPGLARLISWGVAPPYREPSTTGLVMHDSQGIIVYDPASDRRIFQRFEDVPPLVVHTLLFIENRRIDDGAGGRQNPAIDWPRSSKALASYTGRGLGFDLRLEGGSTLATQLEKYRHSPGGRTSSASQKLRQVVGASLKAYHAGRDTHEERAQIIIDYLNTIPLGAAPGVGEIQGLGDGLRSWFAMDLAQVRAALERPQADFEKARAYRHVLALLYSVHAPTRYLRTDHRALESRINAYARLLHAAGVVDRELLNLLQKVPLEFTARRAPGKPPAFVERKAINAVRLDLAERLKVGRLYELDGLHVQVDSTVDSKLQEQVAQLLRRLATPQFAAAKGLSGPRTLARGDPRGVTHSFLLLESRPEGNFVRVQTDTRDGPFDVNEGMKIELGSTAKLRTLAHYLELIARLHAELSPLGGAALERRAALARDPLTRWAAATLRAYPGVDLDTVLRLSVERQYSASPGEAFFTGGGVHHFRNFNAADNGRVISVRDAAVHSINLVFVRLLRDVVRFHEVRLSYDAKAVLEHNDDPVRRTMLTQIADDESQRALARAYRRYRNLGPAEIMARLLKGHERSLRHLAIVFYAWQRERAPEAGGAAKALGDWLQARIGRVTPAEVQKLEWAYGNPRLTIADFGHLLSRHPLELWCAGELASHPGIGWTELLERSAPARRIASAWLFKTRNRKAQDLRLRTRIERDAFAQMTPCWRDLGFAFEELVPSYATAIGSSADRPMALAELMGIIVNDGQRRPTVEVDRLSFAVGTPYQTALAMRPGQGRQVMRPSVARLLKDVLAEVVERGTARGLNHAFLDADGTPIRVGGKTGSGDNRVDHFGRGGRLLSSQPTSRTASFVFYLGDRWFGVITASVSGAKAAQYGFTSALPVAILKLSAPALTDAMRRPERRRGVAYQREMASKSLVNTSISQSKPIGKVGLAIGADYAR